MITFYACVSCVLGAVHLPSALLACRAVSREVEFYSEHSYNNFHVVQTVALHGHTIEEWRFHFGFVMPQSTNTWENIISADTPDAMIPAAVLRCEMCVSLRHVPVCLCLLIFVPATFAVSLRHDCSGYLTITTLFLDGDTVVNRFVMRVHYKED